MKRWGKVHDWIAEQPRQIIGLRVLQVSFGVALLLRVFTEGPYSPYLWGPHGLGSIGSTAPISSSGLSVLRPSNVIARVVPLVFRTNVGAFGAVSVLALGALGLITGTHVFLATGAAYLGLLLLEVRLPELADGGDNIMRICLIYMLFTLPTSRSHERRTVRVWFHNVAVLAIACQVCILYMTSGFQKAFGERWHTGVALYYITRSMWFSHPGLAPLFENPILTAASTYGPMLHQLWFPVAILSPLRLPWIAIGILFHVGIAGLMGLVTFSIAMIGLELFFVTDHEYRRLRTTVNRALGSLRAIALRSPPENASRNHGLALRSGRFLGPLLSRLDDLRPRARPADGESE